MLNLEIHVTRLAGPRLVEAYQAGRADALAFYRGSPWELETYRSKVAEIDARFDRESRRRLSDLVRPLSPGAHDKLDSIVNGNGLFVTTGQQPGLFAGPLYTVYKALTAVQLARALESALERPVLPLFWIASDDHDWEEANHVHVVDRLNRLQRIVAPMPEDAPPASMRRRQFGPEIETTLDAFIQALPTTEFAGSLLEQLRTSYRPGQTVARAFEELIAGLLSGFDIALVDGGQPALKAAASDLFERELRLAGEHEMLLSLRSRALEDAGYHVQVPVLPGATNVFYEDELGRERIFRERDEFVLRRTGRRYPAVALLDALRADPSRFSANVALRPVVESAVFPTVAYVGGPGEVSYFAQLDPLFEAHGIGAPVVFPRHSITLVEAKVRKVLDRFGLDLADFSAPFDQLVTRVAREELPADVTAAIASLRRALREGYERLTRAALGIDPTLEGPLRGARNQTDLRLAAAERRIVSHWKRRHELEIKRLERAAMNLYPAGEPQERILNVHQYLVRYGSELLPAIAERMDVGLNVVSGSPR